MSRLQAAALADRLVFWSDTTFQQQDAVDLLALMPAAGWARRLRQALPGVSVSGQIPGLGASGVAAGVGNVKMEGDSVSFDFDLQGRPCLRAGQWRIYREDSLLPGRCALVLEQVMGGDEREARIFYRRGVPVRMLRLVGTEAPLGPLVLKFSVWKMWKVPT